MLRSRGRIRRCFEAKTFHCAYEWIYPQLLFCFYSMARKKGGEKKEVRKMRKLLFISVSLWVIVTEFMNNADTLLKCLPSSWKSELLPTLFYLIFPFFEFYSKDFFRINRQVEAKLKSAKERKTIKGDLILKLREKRSKAFIHLSQNLVCAHFFSSFFSVV